MTSTVIACIGMAFIAMAYVVMAGLFDGIIPAQYMTKEVMVGQCISAARAGSYFIHFGHHVYNFWGV